MCAVGVWAFEVATATVGPVCVHTWVVPRATCGPLRVRLRRPVSISPLCACPCMSRMLREPRVAAVAIMTQLGSAEALDAALSVACRSGSDSFAPGVPARRNRLAWALSSLH